MADTILLSAAISPQSLSAMERQLANAASNGLKRGFGAQGIDRSYTQALGSMTGATRTFDSVLNAANKRVLGFGISLGIIGGAVRGFRDLISTTRDVESSIARIQSVMALTGRQADVLRGSLFNLARQTGESFDDATTAVEQFSKAGGTLATVMKRAETALSLARVGNISAADSVKGLTAAFLTFSKSGESVVSIANKVSAATRVFPLGVKDALDVLGKFGPQAEAAGVSLNRLLGIITALQARTGSGGQSVSSSLERIFARLQNPQNVQKLSSIPGLQLLDNSGQIKSGIALLDELIKRFNTLSRANQNLVASTLGSTFGSGANATRALIADLASANGLAAQATRAAAQSAGDLQSRLLTQTNNLDQSLKNLGTTAKEVGSIIGRFSVAPALNNIAGVGNVLGRALQSITQGQGDGSVGGKIGQDILKGIGNVISGPGIIVLGRILVGAVRRTLPEVFSELKQAGGFGKGGVSQADVAVLRGINQTLSQATEAEQARFRAAVTVREQEQAIAAILERQVALSRQLAGQNLGLLQGVGAGELRGQLGEVGRFAAGGYIPAMGLESAAISRGVGGAPAGAKPVHIPNFAFGGGHVGSIVANSSEFIVRNAAGSAIYNREMIHRFGLPPGATPVAAQGYVPHMADAGAPPFGYGSLFTDTKVGKGLHGATPLVIGNQLSNEKIDKLNDLFASIEKAGSKEEAQGLGAQITDIAVTLDKPSFKAVFSQLNQQLAQFDTVAARAKSQARSAKIFFGGEASGSAVFIPPGEGDQPTPALQVGNITQADIDRYNSNTARRLNSTPVNGVIGANPSSVLFEIEQNRLRRAEEAEQLERAQRIERIGASINQAALAASFASAFIPEGRGGTRQGEILGALSGGLQGFGAGAFAGGLVGSVVPVIGNTLGAAVGGGIGALVGGVGGYLGKRSASFNEVAGLVQDQNANASQQVQAANAYVQATVDLRDALRSGADPAAIRRLSVAKSDAFNALPASLKTQFVQAGQGVNNLESTLAAIASSAQRTISQGNVLTQAAHLADVPNDIGSRSSLIDTLANSLSGTAGLNLDPRALASVARRRGYDYNRQVALPEITAALTKSGQFDAAHIQQISDQLGKLNPKGLFNFLAALQKAYDENRQALSQASSLQSNGFDYGALGTAIQNITDSIEAGLAATTGLRQYISQATGQRVSAVQTILGNRSGRFSGFGSKRLSGNQLAGAFQVRSAQSEVDLSLLRAEASAREAFLGAINPEAFTTKADQPAATALLSQIKSAKSVADFQSILQNPAIKGDPKVADKLDKVVQGIADQVEQGKRQVQLVQDSVRLQQLELQATQEENLLQRGTFNPSRISSYFLGGPQAGRGGVVGSLLNVNARLGQSNTLDSFGLINSPGTSDLQHNLRAQSTLGTLQVLAARALGRPVGSTVDDIQNAAEQIRDQELGQRIFYSADALRPGNDAQSISQRIFGKPGSVGLSDLQAAVTQGQLSLGDAKQIDLLQKVADNTKALVDAYNAKQPAVAPPFLQSQGATFGSQFTYFNSRIASTLSPFAASPSPLAPVGNIITAPPRPGIFANGQGRQYQYRGANSPETFSSQNYLQGFSFGLTDLNSDIKSNAQIGYESAQTLNSAFSKFFSDFATGAEHGRLAFRQFVSSIFADESRLFSQQAFTSLFSSLGGVFGDSGAKGHAAGGYIGLASGGTVPVMLTGGEYVFTPDQARRLGPRALQALNAGVAKGYAGGGGVVRGGSGVVDDVPSTLPQGSYVVKRSMVQRYGAGYLSSLAAGRYLPRDLGGDIAGLFGSSSSALGYGIFGSLAGGILGAVLDRKNRAAGALLGAAAGFGLGFLGGSIFGGPTSGIQIGYGSDSSNAPLLPNNGGSGGIYDPGNLLQGGASPVSVGSSQGGSNPLVGFGEKLAASAILGGVDLAISPSSKTLDTLGEERNYAAISADQAGYIANRPAGSFVNAVRGPDGQYHILGYTGPASTFSYANGAGVATNYGYADGGAVGYMPSVSAPAGSNGVANVIQPTITIHNYGNGQVSSSATAGGGNSPFGSQEFADQLHKAVVQVVQDQLVQAQRVGGAFANANRNVPGVFSR